MNAFARTLVVSVALLAMAAPALAQGALVESYCATLGENDHFASDGYPLDNVAAIIRQDRANFHQFGVRDRRDQSDSIFDLKSNRARLEAMLRKGSVDRAAQRAILGGTPDICVDVYDDSINVFLQ